MHPEVDLNDEAREDRPTAEAPPDDASPHGAGATLPYVDSSANPVSLPTMQTGESDMPRIPGLDRYEDLGVLGQGGMGEVRRVRDRRLGRTLALKIIRPRALNRPGLVARFLEEAQATAQLQHPNIVPVYDLGELPDGRLWFTMKEVTGQTLATVLKLLRGAPVEASVPAHQAWTFRRAVSALVQVCGAMDYAHRRGVVHRDLKPANIMVGQHGEILVMDWGIAKIMGHSASADDADDPSMHDDAVQTERSIGDAHQTQMGSIAGTPAYMAPEQARGQVHKVTARSDIYALGAMLYELLAGQPPYQGSDARSVLEQVRDGPPRPLSTDRPRPGRPGYGSHARPSRGPGQAVLPPLLVSACERAMARNPHDRFRRAGELGDTLQAWLEGSQRRQDALDVMAGAQALAPQAAAMRQRAAALRAEARELLAPVERWAPEGEKLPGWQKEDEAAALEQQSEALEIEEELACHGALAHAPDLPEAHAALAARYRAEHAAIEAEHGDPARVEARLRHHLSWLPRNHPERSSHKAYLQGDGLLTLRTSPPGASVDLLRYESHRRRLSPRLVRTIGETPLERVRLPMGSYMCVIRHPDCEPVSYPVSLGRNEHWDGVPPEARAPEEILLPRRGTLTPDERYVPGGWAWVGGDSEVGENLARRRVWVDPFIAQRFPVTNRAYIDFLDDLVAQGRTEDALLFAPRERGGTEGADGPLIVGFNGTRFSLRPDSDGDLWEEDYPVTMVSWAGANAYAAWLAQRTGQPWRLPGELMWEKAARGVDGRRFPWGDGFDPSWGCMKDSHPGRYLPAVVGRFPIDESPYGLRGMAGNSADWCADVFHTEGPDLASARGPEAAAGPQTGDYRVVRGAGWFSTEEQLRSANRRYLDPSYRGFDLGFRVVRWLTPAERSDR